jgi:hypothetical protein
VFTDCKLIIKVDYPRNGRQCRVLHTMLDKGVGCRFIYYFLAI